MSRHLRIADFALLEVLRRPGRLIAVVIVYSLLVFISASLLLYVEGMRAESRRLLAESPDLLVQRLSAGRHDAIPLDRADEILSMRSVRSVEPRVWGYAYDPPTGATLTIWGLDPVVFRSVGLQEGRMPADGGECAIGAGIADARLLELEERLPLRGADDALFAPRIVGIFSSESAILTNDLVIMTAPEVRRIFSLESGVATDLAVSVANPAEVDTVARKILERWGDVRCITREQVQATYDGVFDWRGGMWASALLLVIAAFAVLVWDAASGFSSEEARTLGLLKAVGWTNREIMEVRVWQGVTVSLASCLTGILLAMIHVVAFDGALVSRAIRGWSALHPAVPIEVRLDGYGLLLCVALTVLPYTAASLVPAWRAAMTDPDSAMRT